VLPSAFFFADGGAAGVWETCGAGAVVGAGAGATLIFAPSLNRFRAVDDDAVARREAARDDGVLAVARPQRDLVHRRRIVLVHEVDVVARRAAQHGRRRHQHGLVQRIDEQLDVDEFVGEQGFVVVGEARAQRDGACTRDHLVVDGIERAGRQLLAAVAAVGRHRQLHVRRPESLDHLLEIILGNRELDRRRLDRRDDGNSGAR